MPTRYSLSNSGQRVDISASAPGHRFEVSGTGLRGHFELDDDQLTLAEFELDLASLTANDRLKDHELRRFLDIPNNRSAKAELLGPAKLTRHGAAFEGRAQLRFRLGPREASAEIRLSGPAEAANATFTLRFTQLGYKPPRLLLLSVKDELQIRVALRAEETAPPHV